MTTNVFFAFHYEQDLWRAQIVRQAWLNQGGEALGFWDEAAWQQARNNEQHLKLIDQAIRDAEVTAVLITLGTSDIGYVQHAVRNSHQERKGLLAIYLHNIPDPQGSKAPIGNTHFGELGRDATNSSLFFRQLYPVHRWVIEDGPGNLKQWIEDAATAARRTREGVTDA